MYCIYIYITFYINIYNIIYIVYYNILYFVWEPFVRLRLGIIVSAQELEQWLEQNPDLRPLPSPVRQASIPVVDPSPASTVQDKDLESLASGNGLVLEVPSETPFEHWEDAQGQPVDTAATPTPKLESPEVLGGNDHLVDPAKHVPEMECPTPTEFGDEAPSVGDLTAPKFKPGEHHISDNAIKMRTKRIFTKRVDGSMKVSETIYNEWKGKGQARKNLEQIFKQCGYDADPCLFFNVSVCNSTLIVFWYLWFLWKPYQLETLCLDLELKPGPLFSRTIPLHPGNFRCWSGSTATRDAI